MPFIFLSIRFHSKSRGVQFYSHGKRRIYLFFLRYESPPYTTTLNPGDNDIWQIKTNGIDPELVTESGMRAYVTMAPNSKLQV